MEIATIDESDCVYLSDSVLVSLQKGIPQLLRWICSWGSKFGGLKGQIRADACMKLALPTLEIKVPADWNVSESRWFRFR